MKFIYKFDEINLVLIPVEIENKKLCFILDTGSTNCLIDNKVVEYFKNIVEPIGKYNIIGIEGTKQEVYTVYLPFIFEGQAYSPKFCVKPLLDAFGSIEDESGIQVHGILGTDFLLENKWIIDFQKLELRHN